MLSYRVYKQTVDGQTDGQTGRQTDGHANLIVGLVTRNPPNNKNVSQGEGVGGGGLVTTCMFVYVYMHVYVCVAYPAHGGIKGRLTLVQFNGLFNKTITSITR